MRSQHENFEEIIQIYQRDHTHGCPQQSDSSKPTHLQVSLHAFIPEKVIWVYSWINWIVTDLLPFALCEKNRVRNYSKLKSISRKTVMKYMDKIVLKVEDRECKTIPNILALIFDGWTCGDTHYVALLHHLVAPVLTGILLCYSHLGRFWTRRTWHL